MPAMTVTLSGSTGTAALAVKVLTGAAGAQPGKTGTSTSNTSAAITPNATGSIVYGALQVFFSLTSGGTTLYTPLASTSVIGDATNGTGREAAALRSAAATTAGVPVTLGMTAKGMESTYTLALCEILQAAGQTLAEDASSPPVVPASGVGNLTPVTSVSTASFTPPGGALLVAMASTGGGTPAISDSAGLTWTRQALAGPSSAISAGIWTAPVPVTGISPTAGLARAVAAALSAVIALPALPGRSTGTSVAPAFTSTAAVGEAWTCEATVTPGGSSVPAVS